MSHSDFWVRALAFAKINLALKVLGRRDDGYHELWTIFQSIDLADELELHPADELSLEIEGVVPGELDDNLILRAARALCAATGVRAAARMRLKKRIPVGSGLGGGSSDAAAALVGLNRLWDLRLAPADLHGLAAALGSDVAYFLIGGCCVGEGRGEVLTPLPDGAESSLLLAVPPLQVSTAVVFASLPPALTGSDSFSNMAEKFLADFGPARDSAFDAPARSFNDLQPGVLEHYPLVRAWRERLAALGAVYVRMSGSGSALYARFSTAGELEAARQKLGVEWGVTVVRTVGRTEYQSRHCDVIRDGNGHDANH